MGFLRQLFGFRTRNPKKEKKRRSFSVGSPDHGNTQATPSRIYLDSSSTDLDPNKHAIAVAAATAAVAEAALAAAHAAAEVVRLTRTTSSVGCGSRRRWTEDFAAVKIQSAFRGYLARRALKALKALVKLQALVRGHMVRKQTADMLKRMQTLVRVQARARASRAHLSESLHSSSKSSLLRRPVPATPDLNGGPLRAYSSKFDGSSIFKRCSSNSNFRDVIDPDKPHVGSNWLDRWMEESLRNNRRDISLRNGHTDDEKSDKILEVDTWKPHLNSQKIPFQATGEFMSLSSLKIGKDGATIRTAENSPQVYSASSRPGHNARRGPFTPTRSECAWGFFSGYSGHPNYMANTESSRAKVRSQSAPRQRLEFENFGSTRSSVQGFWDAGSNSDRAFSHQTDYRNKTYPDSSRLSRLWSSNLR
ncbi:hypothetical protein CIPAW_04G066600 [Carya illinoinensis]|uniref:DUF4005 domain-containing protein n=1 Tax=Carya illinoinensis TaxID=32201 RepID=A0A8T1QR61_CARIL|nr:hypothetical protein CIPAW_04G066600 [Carya illinoinensis]